jgi:hypothetical protein
MSIAANMSTMTRRERSNLDRPTPTLAVKGAQLWLSFVGPIRPFGRLLYVVTDRHSIEPTGLPHVLTLADNDARRVQGQRVGRLPALAGLLRSGPAHHRAQLHERRRVWARVAAYPPSRTTGLSLIEDKIFPAPRSLSDDSAHHHRQSGSALIPRSSVDGAPPGPYNAPSKPARARARVLHSDAELRIHVPAVRDHLAL